MKTLYKYTGKERSAAGDVFLVPDGKCELESEDAHVKSLIAQGKLVRVQEAKIKTTLNAKTEEK